MNSFITLITLEPVDGLKNKFIKRTNTWRAYLPTNKCATIIFNPEMDLKTKIGFEIGVARQDGTFESVLVTEGLDEVVTLPSGRRVAIHTSAPDDTHVQLTTHNL